MTNFVTPFLLIHKDEQHLLFKINIINRWQISRPLHLLPWGRHKCKVPRGEYSGLANTEKCKLQREKAKKMFWLILGERERLEVELEKRILKKLLENKQKIQKDQEKTRQDLVNSAHTKVSRHLQRDLASKQTQHRSLSKADAHLPNSSNKKAEIIQRLATKYTMRIDLSKNRGIKRNILSSDKKQRLLEFLN